MNIFLKIKPLLIAIYCYACDNDVKDEQLPQHLINFGIDINLQQKTEKTMAEMSLEFNLNLTLSKQIEDGKILTPIYGSGFTGMENLGNSCYMNSIVQILFSLENFKGKFFDNSLIHLTTCLNNPEDCFICQVSKLMFGLYSGQYSVKQTRILPKITDDPNSKDEIEEFQQGVKPFSFKYFFAKENSEFSSNRQQDAFEYLNHLFEKFNFYLKNKNLNIKQDYEFELETRFECLNCSGVKYKTQKTWYLPLSVPNWETRKDESSKCTLDEALEKFLAEEIIENIDCPKCKSKSKFAKNQKIKNYPKYFIVLFQRFVYDWVPIKLEVQLSFNPDNVNLKVLSRNHGKINEKVLEDSSEIAKSEDPNEEIEIEPEFDQDKLNILIMNGVPELAAKHSLINANNNTEDALMWFFTNLENKIINQPIQKIKMKKNVFGTQDANFGLSTSSIEMISSMGFTREQAIGALKKSNDNTERALEFLFENPDFDFLNFLENLKNIKEEKPENLAEINKQNTDNYDLYGNQT